MPSNRLRLVDAFPAARNPDQLRYFLLWADKLHFWQTAAQLPRSQSALRRHVQRLEAGLGFCLLERTPRQVRCPARRALRVAGTDGPELSVILSPRCYIGRPSTGMEARVGNAGKIEVARPTNLPLDVLRGDGVELSYGLDAAGPLDVPTLTPASPNRADPRRPAPRPRPPNCRQLRTNNS